MTQIIESIEAAKSVVPADEEWFDFEYDSVDPMEIIRSTGCDPSGWKYLGPNLEGHIKYRAKLIRLGTRDLTKAQQFAADLGYRLVEGQALETFQKKYSVLDNDSPIIFGGSIWQYMDHDPKFCLLGGLLFGYGPESNWRWLVVEKETR